MNNADMEDGILEITQSGQQTEKQMKTHESSTRDLWDKIKLANLHIIGIPEGEEKAKGIENIFEEIMAENHLNLEEADIKIQEEERAPEKLTSNRPTPRHIMIKMAKVKERSLKAAREKQRVIFKGTTHPPLKAISCFLSRNTTGQREWQDIFRSQKGKNLQPNMLLPERVSFKIEEFLQQTKSKRAKQS
uniref:L1 transposable element RRM domain-containing protein n=1 Tax=Sus scrofa TaxID=9823 RepID=A0A4X1US24_PIG